MANFVLFMLEIALFTRLTLQSSFWLRMAFVQKNSVNMLMLYPHLSSYLRRAHAITASSTFKVWLFPGKQKERLVM